MVAWLLSLVLTVEEPRFPTLESGTYVLRQWTAHGKFLELDCEIEVLSDVVILNNQHLALMSQNRFRSYIVVGNLLYEFHGVGEHNRVTGIYANIFHNGAFELRKK